MVKYKCVLIDETKNTFTRVIEAENELALMSKIKQFNYFLVSKEEVKVEKKIIKKLRVKDLIVFCRQLSIMLQSGITIIKAIDILAQKADNKSAKQVYDNIYEAMQKGQTLSIAMKFQEVFPDILLSMVEAGEVSGSLENNLARMGEHFEKENRLNNKVKGALMYPIVLAIVATVVVILLVTMVLPTFFSLYDGQELPLPTQIIVGFSNFLTNNWLITILFIGLLVLVIPVIGKISSVRKTLDTWKLNMPIVGKLNRTIYSARCARSFASLYSSGLDMIDILRMLSNILGNVVIQEKFQTVIAKVSRGEFISLSMQDIKIFDPMFTSMVYIGEESGSLDTILNTAADYFDEEADTATTRLVGLIEPLMMIVMGLVIGFIVIAIMLPMYGMMGNIQ